MKENFMNFYSKNWDHRVADQKLLDYGIDLSTDFGEVILMTVLLGQNVRDVVMQNPVQCRTIYAVYTFCLVVAITVKFQTISEKNGFEIMILFIII